MKKRNALRLGAVGIGAAALAVGIAAGAQAAPLTVSVGGSTANTTYDSLATNTAGISFSADANPSGTVPMSCSGVSLPGTVTGGTTSTYPPGTFATVSAGGTWSGCTGLTLDLAVSNSAWTIGATGAPVSGVTPGIIPDVHAEVQDIDFGGLLCDFDVDGSVTGTFDEATQEITVTASNLTVHVDPNGIGADCAGQIKDGGNATFTGSFHITDNPPTGTPAEFPISIS